MTTENTVAVRSVTEAIIAARQAIRNGQVIPIAPCVQIYSTGKTVICTKLDQTGRILCKDPDGPLSMNGGLECPLQYGRLTLTVPASPNENPVNGIYHNPATPAFKPPKPLSLSLKERRPYRPYFVK